MEAANYQIVERACNGKTPLDKAIRAYRRSYKNGNRWGKGFYRKGILVGKPLVSLVY